MRRKDNVSQGTEDNEATLTSAENGGSLEHNGNGNQVSTVHVPRGYTPIKRQEGLKADATRSSQGENVPSPDELLARKAAEEHKSGQSNTSYESTDLWAAVGSPIGIQSQSEAQTSLPATYEDGEFEEKEDQGPPPNQETNRRTHGEAAQGHDGGFPAFAGEHRRPPPDHDEGPTARKRSWNGSTTSEEDRRPLRKPRVTSRTTPTAPALLPIRELTRNPWCSLENTRNASYNDPLPVAMSTPRQSHATRNAPPFFHDELADVSGHPPTIRGSSIDSRSDTSTEGGNEYLPQTGTRTRRDEDATHADMDVDGNASPRRDSNLWHPLLERRATDARRTDLTRDGARSLKDVLTEPEPRSHDRRAPRQEHPQRDAGYTQEDADESAFFGFEEGSGRGLLRTGDGEAECDRARRRSLFSALPNTKAYEFRHGKQVPVEGSPYAIPETPRRRTGGRDSSQRESRGRETLGRRCLPDTPPTRSERAYDNNGEDDAMDEWEEGQQSDGHAQDERQETRAWVEEEEPYGDGHGGDTGRWQGISSQRLPSALRGVDELEDTPVLAKNPHSELWTVHQSDPEEMLTGLSQEWMAKVWLDAKPVVLLTVYNYKFTRDLEINKHIESSISALTTYITGETRFHVVPPHPEWRRNLAPRDLPFIWAIRGLSEEAAWEMIKAHVISADGVSVITHQRTITNPTLVCGLAGFLRPDVETTKEAVLDVLNSEYMRARLLELVKSSDRLRHLPLERRVQKVIDSLEVRFMATKEDGEVANVFITPPTDDIDEWRGWADEMRECQYNIFVNGTGAARKPFWCGGCRGVDHEDFDCPFPTMKGWKGPQAGAPSHTKFWTPEERTTKRNGRGRGRGAPGWNAGTSRSETSTGNGRGLRGGWSGSQGQRGGMQRGFFNAGQRPSNIHSGPGYQDGRGQQSGYARRGDNLERGGYRQREGYAPRGGQERRGGMQNGWGYATPSRQGMRSVRY